MTNPLNSGYKYKINVNYSSNLFLRQNSCFKTTGQSSFKQKLDIQYYQIFSNYSSYSLIMSVQFSFTMHKLGLATIDWQTRVTYMSTFLLNFNQ